MKKILFYGDSNTYGFDPRGFGGGRYPEGIRWTSRLSAMSEGRWEIINCGLNGRMIPSTSWQMKELRKALQNEKPDLLSVMLGTNDLLNAMTPSAENVAAHMEHFLRDILNEYPADTGMHVLLVSPPRIDAMDAGPVCGSESRKLSGLYAQTAKNLHIHFADAEESHPGLAFDGLHLSEEGHSAYANWMKGVLVGLSGSF